MFDLLKRLYAPDAGGEGSEGATETDVIDTGLGEGGEEAGKETTPVEKGATKTYLVDGKQVVLTQEEADTYIQKGLGADKRFRDSAGDRQEAARLRQMTSDIRAANGGDISAIKRLSTYPELGVSEDQVSNLVKRYEDAANADAAKRKVTQPVKLDMNHLPREAQEAIAEVAETRRQKDLADIKTQLKNTLDTDSVLGHISKGEAKRSERLGELALERVRAIVQRTQTYGPETLKAAVQETRQIAQDLGILGTGDDGGDSAAPDRIKLTGLPASPLGIVSSNPQGPKGRPKRPEGDKVLESGTYSKYLFDSIAHAISSGELEAE